MPRAPWANDAVYRTAHRFIDECLRQDGSLFTSDHSVWKLGAIDEFFERFLLFEMSSEDFMTKLKRQLEGLSPEAVQLAAEALFFHLLAEDDTGAAANVATSGPSSTCCPNGSPFPLTSRTPMRLAWPA